MEEKKTRRSRKKETTHRRIMHSAKLLFEKNGIGNVTIEDIAEGADVSRSTFFTHFDSVEDLLTQIADEEINDILSVSYKDGKADVYALFRQLSIDTCPYPSLMSELVIRNILSGKGEKIADLFRLICEEIESEGYDSRLSGFSSKDISSLVLGAYFGLVFQKLIDNEKFSGPDEIYGKITGYIKYLKNQEEEK